jgi:hypothetical protein
VALVKLRDFLVPGDGTFIAPIATLEQLGATRAMITTDDGVCQGYAHTDGRLWPGPLVTPTSAKIAADAAAVTAAAALAAKDTAALNAIQAGVDQFRTGGAGTVSNVQRDRWLAGLTWMLFRRE